MNKEIYRIWKRSVSVLITICMTAVMMLSPLAGVAYASTELPDRDLGEGACSSTAYKWIGPTEAQGDVLDYRATRRFDIVGLKAGQTKYSDDKSKVLETTFQFHGYTTYIEVDGSLHKVDIPDNGRVEDVTDLGVEVRIALSPSPDDKYIYVDYYVYNKTGDKKDIWLGSGADTKIGDDDGAVFYRTSNGLHMVNRNDNSTFDCITYNPALGATGTTHTWMGDFRTGSWCWGRNMFADNTDPSCKVKDSAVTYSWNFNLRPFELVHKRVAFVIKDTTYYVSHGGSDTKSAEGTYQRPFQTIQYALDRIGNRKGYILLMDDYDISGPITISGNVADITVGSTDYSGSGTPVKDIKTLTRSSGSTASLFKVTGGAMLRLTDIKLDGNGQSGEDALLSADSGRLEINSGADIRNCHGASSNQGSAVNITGSADLSMNFGKVSGNTSEGKGAVYFNSSGTFDVRNDVFIQDNVNAAGAKANVYLADGKTVTVTGDLNGARIGVTTEKRPAASPEGIATEAGQEVKVAVPGEGNGATGACPFADNFFADQAKELGVYVSAGTKNLTGAGADNNTNAVLRRNRLQISFAVNDADTGAALAGVPSIPAISKGAGETVDTGLPPGILGYELAAVTVDQGVYTSLQTPKSPGVDFGRITGTMPNQDVTVNYGYRKIAAQIIFNSNGGTPEPPTLVGTAGGPVSALLPTTSRYGYTFKGWSSVNDWKHPQFVKGLPSVFPLVPVTYYAIFEADPTIRFNYTVEHTNQLGNIVFDPNPEKNTCSVETSLHEEKKNIKNYAWSKADSDTTPTEYNFSGTSIPLGQFNDGGTFTGKMPGQDVTVHYRYKVRYDDPSTQSLFTVKYETDHFNTVAPERTAPFFPEDPITAQPADVYGFECTGYKFDTGKTAGNSDGGYVYGVTGDVDENTHAFSGVMPNQPVTLVYLYEATIKGYEMTVKYEDDITGDARLKDIVPPDVSGPHKADSEVEGDYQDLYGYSVTGSQVKPDGAAIRVAPERHYQWGGTMPNDDAQVIYHHSRTADKWTDITYKSELIGSLKGGEGVSPDVQEQHDGSFRASILRNDGTDLGKKKAYTLAQMKEKCLMPVPVPSDSRYYCFDGWFIDKDNSGDLNGTETILPEDYQFDGPATVTAHFRENPDAWINIKFTAGEHGSIKQGKALSLHTTRGKTWGDIQDSLPDYQPEVNYLVDDWYVQGEPVTDDMPLVKDQTYTIQFYPDPVIFGTDVSEPEAVSELNSQGKGRISVFGTTQGYQYILTDLNGEVLGVNRGNRLTSRTEFDNLYPGMRYLVYEATGSTKVQVGDMIGAVAGTVSGAAKVLTPAVEANYQIYYDEKDEGKTQLSVKPGDQASDYAVLDHTGTPVHTPQTGGGGWQKPSGNPAELSFTGLDYNQEYTVVARPTGRAEITAESRVADGSVIKTDPGGELELPSYIIETLNGEIESVAGAAVGTSRYEEAHKGDRVKITADPVNSDGKAFSHWKFTIGGVKGLGIKIDTQAASFTMPDTNLVLTAVYERPTGATPSNARVADEVRGGSREDLAMDPNEVPDLEAELTTDEDSVLRDLNRADVTYKVVYRKNAVKATESNAIKAGGTYDPHHEEAFKGAWGLDVSIDRYVNGRRVTRATESNATFNTYVQLEKGDTDMKDYQLYEFSRDPDGGTAAPSLVTMDYDPEETSGLFTFRATEGKRYVMVYNRTYRLYFLNNTVPKESRYRYWFKVRGNESPSDPYYSDEYGRVEDQLEYFVGPNGAEYSYEGWSYRPDKQRDFDPDRKITRKTWVYAYYGDNIKDVDDTRRELEAAVKAAVGISDDHFLKLHESKKLKEFIGDAQEVLDRKSPQATAGDLETALAVLKDKTAPYKELLDNRYNHYNDIHRSGNKGGSKGGGGGGAGTRSVPFNNISPKSCRIGINGNWIESTGPAGEKQLSFQMNGGSLLRGMWSRLEYPDASQTAGNGWYRFDDKGVLQTGWICDETGSWYYCNTGKEGNTGKMATDWKLDGSDGNWYYLDPVSGAMALGWRQIGGKWYYFSSTGAGVYTYDPAKVKWTFGGGSGRPLGSMYKNEVTPDGCQVDANGAWIQ